MEAAISHTRVVSLRRLDLRRQYDKEFDAWC